MVMFIYMTTHGLASCTNAIQLTKQLKIYDARALRLLKRADAIMDLSKFSERALFIWYNKRLLSSASNDVARVVSDIKTTEC